MTAKAIIALLLAVPFALVAFEGYRLLRDDFELELERRTQAEAGRAHKEVMRWFESTWTCKGFDLNRECNLRERN